MLEYVKRCGLCLLSEKEIGPFLKELKTEEPDVEMAFFPKLGAVELLFQGQKPLDYLVQKVHNRFPTFYYGEGYIEEKINEEFIARKKTLALAESCTGGAIAAKLVAIPDTSKYLLGSIVAYSNGWKERFLQVSHTSIQQFGAASKEVVTEMAQGLFNETDADYVAAISGFAGSGTGTLFIAIGQRGQKIDAGVVYAPKNRTDAIALGCNLTLGALWRRIVHNAVTFS